MPRINKFLVLWPAGLVLALLAGAASAHAQAWVPPKGEGTVAVLFSNVLSRDHFLPDERMDLGHIHANTLLFDVTYGLSHQVALGIGLPLVMSRYSGNFPHRPVTLDDGSWHVTPQDFRFNLRYNVTQGPLVVTPFVGGSLPSHGYEYYAHAAPGKRLREMVAGVLVGKLFAGPGIVVQGRYGFAVAERVMGFSPRHSQMALEIAYFVGPSARVFAMGSGRLGHTGIDLTPSSPAILPFEIFREHDRISREHAFNLGGGTAVSLSDSLDLFGSYTRTVTGRNTHAVNRGVAVGLSWSFSRSGADRFEVARGREGSLIRCLCEKAAVD